MDSEELVIKKDSSNKKEKKSKSVKKRKSTITSTVSGKTKKSKAKKYLKKKIEGVKEVFTTMKAQLIDTHGFMYRMETP